MKMIVLLLLILLAVIAVRCIGYKIALEAMIAYIKDHGEIPDDDEIRRYMGKAADRLFHFKNK